MSDEKIVLDAPLHYINTGRGKDHIIHEMHQALLCGRGIDAACMEVVSRKLAPRQLCLSCYTIAKRTYPNKIRIERPGEPS